MSEMGQLAVIVASVRKDRIGPMVARWFLSRVQANTAAAVDAGGISGGLRAVEQLRMIFAELHVVTVQAAVSLPHVWDQFDEHGNLRQPERPGSAADTLLRQVAWWGRTLREAKAQRPLRRLITAADTVGQVSDVSTPGIYRRGGPHHQLE